MAVNRRLFCLLLAMLLTFMSFACTAEEGLLVEEELLTPIATSAPEERTPRDDLIDRIIAQGESLYTKANGKAQRAHYKEDIYVCKNFTTYVFRQSAGDFRMAEYPTVKMKVPNNLPKDKCKPYYYGYCWEDVAPSKGNPFYVAAQFLYDSNLTKQENMAAAVAFMRQVRRGDYFQMTAEYSAGTGAHSAIMIADYDPVTDSVHWMDSNMRGFSRNGIRYGYVQFDAEASVQWWAEAFCLKKRGATLYRLRDDIIYATDAQ